MAYRRPLAYLGVAQPTPPNQTISDREPTANDVIPYNIGDRWIVPTQASTPSQQEWILMSKAQNQAIWVDVATGGAATYNDHELLVGTGTSTVNTIPTGVSGRPLVSFGAAADPEFTVLFPEGGGTGNDTWTPYTPILGGTTATGALQSVASTGTSGQVLTSNGAGMLPSFQAPGSGVLPVSGGGTGDTSFTAYAVVTGGITSVDPLQTVASLGTANQVLTSQGAGLLPTWSDNAAGTGFTSIVSQVFTGSGTYTPTANMEYCTVEAIGGGGAGGAVDGLENHGAGGGGAGGYCRKVIDAATIGASQVVTIGAGGVGAAGNNGGNGGSTTFGAILTAGAGGGGARSTFAVKNGIGGSGGSATGGDVNIVGQLGINGFAVQPSSYMGGSGGSTMYGSAGRGGAAGIAATAATGYGSGGGGLGIVGNSGLAGGAGASGLVVVTEYIGA